VEIVIKHNRNHIGIDIPAEADDLRLELNVRTSSQEICKERERRLDEKWKQVEIVIKHNSYHIGIFIPAVADIFG
jgi:hypothetical protein